MMVSGRLCALVALVFLGWVAVPAEGQSVLLKSGKRVKGSLRSDTDGVIVTKGRTETRVPWADLDWIEMQAKHVSILSRVPPERTEYYREAFERFVHALAATFKFKARIKKSTRVQLRIFRDPTHFKKYYGEEDGDQVFGYFGVDPKSGAKEVVVFDHPHDPAETFDTLLHESTHLMLFLWGEPKNFSFPAWIEEGVAEYFGGSSYRPDARRRKNTFAQGLQKAHHLAFLHEGLAKEKILPLAEFLRIGNETFDVEHYPQAWSLIHFFAHAEKGRYAPRLYRYCQDLMRTVREGDRAIELFEKTFKIKVDKLEAQWKEYVRTLRPSSDADRLALAEYHARAGTPKVGLEVVAPLLEADKDDYRALAIRAELLAMLSTKKSLAEAKKLSARALELAPDYAPARFAKALAAHYAGEWREAQVAYARYRECEPLRLDTAMFQFAALLDAPKKLRDAKAARAAGEQLLAYHVDAELHVRVGDACALLDDPAAAVGHYERALEVNPMIRGAREKLDAARKQVKSE